MFNPDLGKGTVWQGVFALGAIGNIVEVALPVGSTGVRIRPLTTDAKVIYALGEDPAALGAAALAVGNVAIYGEADPRTFYAIEEGDDRDLRLRSDTLDCDVLVEVFA